MRRRARPLLPGQKAVMGRKEIEIGQALHNESDGLASKYATYDVYLHDNRSDTNKEPHEPTLFVGRDPHQVRSLADSGVLYNFDKESKLLDISLEDPVMKPEYEIDSVLPVTAHRLCLNCLDTLNYFCKYREQQVMRDRNDEKSRLYLSNCVIHHANLMSLLVQARIDKCQICTAIYRRLDRWEDLSYPQYEDYRIEVAFPQRTARGVGDDDLLVFAMVRSDTKKEPVWNWSVLLELRLWPEDKYLHHFRAELTHDDLDIEEYQSMSPDELSVNKSPLTRGIVRSWVRKCMANEDGKHVGCNRRDHDYLPSRLLDVGHAAEKSYLRIVCPQDDPSLFEKNRKYATLSHCWGSWGASENPSLNMENLEVRKTEGLSCDKLPQTFRDALEVAGWLNIPYLWIDSLCIIQDSRSDWIHEASLMHHTYQCSTVNISASHGTDSRSGLFTERDPLFITAQQLQAPKIPKHWYVTRDNVFGWTSISAAFSRAWIHRERQLASRILHFMRGEVVWECSGTDGASFASEALPGGAPFKRLWNGNSKYQSNSMIAKSKQGKQMAYALWNDLCETFSTKELTVKSDMPIIMSSLAQEFHRSLPGDEYLAGMWRDTLPQALAWHTNEFWPEGDINRIAPTWSWLSTPAPIGVSFVQKVRMERLVPLAKVVDVKIVREEGYQDNEYGPVKSGILKLEGFVRKIWFTFDGKGGFELAVADTLVDGEEDDNSKSTLREIGKNWDEYEGEVCEAEFDGKIKDEEYCCWCMFTSIEEWMDDRNLDSQWREITAILLERSGDEDNEEGQWIRTGTMRMKDIFALKMRYKACWELDTDPEDEEKDKEKDDTVKTDQSDGEDTHDGIDDTETQEVQQRLVESSNKVTDASTDVPEDQIPQAEQSHPETDQNTSEKEDTSPSEPEPEAQSEPGNESTKSSPEPKFDPWEHIAHFIQRKRFEVCQTEKAAKKALKDKAKSKDEGDASQNNQRDNENKTENENDQVAPGQSITKQETPTPDSSPDLAATSSVAASAPAQSGPSRSSTEPSDSHEPSEPDPQTTPAAKTTTGPPPVDTTPIHGHTNLDPAESLYQFDQSLAQVQAEGYFKWLRRLDVRRIEIV